MHCALLGQKFVALLQAYHFARKSVQVVGQKIAQLEARKRSAVEKEDYDTAKTIKVGSSCNQGFCCGEMTRLQSQYCSKLQLVSQAGLSSSYG